MASNQLYDNYSIASEHCIFLNFNSTSHKLKQCVYIRTSPPLTFFLDVYDDVTGELCVCVRASELNTVKGPNPSDSTQLALAQIVPRIYDEYNEKWTSEVLYKDQDTFRFRLFFGFVDTCVVVRFLEKRCIAAENPFPPLDEHDVLTIIVGTVPDSANGDDGQQKKQQTFEVSAYSLMCSSPVFHRMLTTEMRERGERVVRIPDVDPKDFRAFLSAIKPVHPSLPNPTNVCQLLVLADRYEVRTLMDRCEEHLKNCVEIPLIERIQLADKYQHQLDNLMHFLLEILVGAEELRAFGKYHRAAIDKLSIGTKDKILDILFRD